MTTATIHSKIKRGTLLAEIASAMQNPNGNFVFDLETLEVVETTNDNRDTQDHVVMEDGSWDMLPEWAQNAPSIPMMTNHQPDRFISIPSLTKKEMLNLMKAFTKQVKDENVFKKLNRATLSKNPLIKFKNELSFHTGYRTLWINFKQKTGLKLAKKWIKEQKLG